MQYDITDVGLRKNGKSSYKGKGKGQRGKEISKSSGSWVKYKPRKMGN
jgi:hypothetical protein